jgi:type I restriction enzyme, S subunit
MKAVWEKVRLADICTFKPPKAEARKKLLGTDFVSFVPMDDLGINQKYFHPSSERPLSAVAGSYTYFSDGDVLLAKITPCFENGKLGIARSLVNGIGFGSSEYFVIRPSKDISAEFLYYFLLQPTFREAGAKSMTGAVGHKRVAKEFLEGCLIPLPSIKEQHRIVTLLDEAFASIATARAAATQNLQNARALFESHLQSVFNQRDNDWTEESLDDVCEISSVLVDPRKSDFLEMLHVGGANIESKTGGLHELKSAREEALISGKFIFDESMVLYSKIRPYLMKVARPDFKGLCSADIYPLSAKKKRLNRDYLFHLLLSPAFTDYANAGSARAGMPKVNREHLFAYRSYFPPIDKQVKFAALLDTLHEETQRLESIYQRKIKALDELKQSLLHQAFSGQLTADVKTRKVA